MKFYLSACIFLVTYCATAAASSMVIKYGKHEDMLDARQHYKHELIKLILEQTKAEYGNYRIEPHVISDPGVKRTAKLLSEGDLENLDWNSPGGVIGNADVITIPIDILRGLLGYRICLVNRTGSANFAEVLDASTLNGIRIGQSSSWTDYDIYTFNKIMPVSAPTLDGLLLMLAYNRFDCLALGATEIEDIYHEKLATMPMLAIEKSLLIYYDFPVYFFVSKKYPLLAERFKKGLQALQANGEFDKLFNRYFQHKLAGLDMPNRHVICLKSPYFLAVNQCRNLEQINLHYKATFLNQ